MAIVLSGSTGIQNPLGSAAAPSESNTTNSNTGAYFPTGTTYGIATNGTSAMYIDASQNVGIGTSTPGSKADVAGTIRSTGANAAASGAGVEIDYGSVAAATGRIFAFDRSASTRKDMVVDGATVQLYTGGSSRMYIDASGNVGIGTSSPATLLHVNGASPVLRVSDSVGTGVAQINARNSTASSTWGVDTNTGSITGTANSAYWYNSANTPSVFFTNATERMRIDSSGNLLVGTTISNPAGATYSGQISVVNAGGTTKTGINIATTGTTSKAIEFQYSGSGVIGSISTTTSTTSYNTSSDYRLKHDVQPMTNGLATIGALKPVTYKWNADDSDGEGFIAHELQDVIPHAVTGIKDDVDDEGRPIHQGVDYSKIVVHLVAALQEAVAKIDDLSAEVTALKAKVGA